MVVNLINDKGLTQQKAQNRFVDKSHNMVTNELCKIDTELDGIPNYVVSSNTMENWIAEGSPSPYEEMVLMARRGRSLFNQSSPGVTGQYRLPSSRRLDTPGSLSAPIPSPSVTVQASSLSVPSRLPSSIPLPHATRLT